MKRWWLIWGFLAPLIGVTLYSFDRPWTWTIDQCLFVFFAVCLAIIGARFAVVRFRDGPDAFAERWGRVQQMAVAIEQAEADRARKARWWSRWWFWALAAIVLVVFLNVLQALQH